MMPRKKNDSWVWVNTNHPINWWTSRERLAWSSLVMGCSPEIRSTQNHVSVKQLWKCLAAPLWTGSDPSLSGPFSGLTHRENLTFFAALDLCRVDTCWYRWYPVCRCWCRWFRRCSIPWNLGVWWTSKLRWSLGKWNLLRFSFWTIPNRCLSNIAGIFVRIQVGYIHGSLRRFTCANIVNHYQPRIHMVPQNLSWAKQWLSINCLRTIQ